MISTLYSNIYEVKKSLIFKYIWGKKESDAAKSWRSIVPPQVHFCPSQSIFVPITHYSMILCNPAYNYTLYIISCNYTWENLDETICKISWNQKFDAYLIKMPFFNFEKHWLTYEIILLLFTALNTFVVVGLSCVW